MHKIAIIDGDGILYRAVSKAKTVKQAEARYLDIADYYIRESECDASIIYIEGPGNWRKDVFSGYKASRRNYSTPESDSRFNLIKELKKALLKHRGIYAALDCETDDLVRRRAELARKRGQEYVIISSDKDLDVIVGPHIRPDTYGKLKYYIIDQKMSDYNYFYQLLIGDMTDNIKSPEGLGPKTAENLLKGNNRKNWRKLIELEYKHRCGSDWLQAIYFTGSLIHIQRWKGDMFEWKKGGTWFDKGFEDAPSCYKYTDIQLGK